MASPKKKPAAPVPVQSAWPADKVERRPVADLIPYVRNPRKHSAEDVDRVAASVRRYGWTIPVLVDERGTLIAGHCRLLAAKKLGLETVPTMAAAGWTDEMKAAYVIADNQFVLRGTWDNDLLREELSSLRDDDFDLSLTGFDTKDLDELFGGATDAGPLDGIGDAPPSNYSEQYGVIIICESELQQTEFYDKLKAEGYNCKVVAT